MTNFGQMEHDYELATGRLNLRHYTMIHRIALNYTDEAFCPWWFNYFLGRHYMSSLRKPNEFIITLSSDVHK